MLAGTVEAGGFLYSPDPDAINQVIINKATKQHTGDSCRDATDNTLRLFDGERWLTFVRVHVMDDQSGVDMKSLFVGDPSVKELIAAAEGVLQYLNESGRIINVYPIYRPPSSAMREAADEIDARDAAIQRFLDALKKAKGN
jgi:hypothetical protein